LNIALYITESISKPLDVRGAEGYLEGYDDFDIELVEELSAYLKDMEIIQAPKNDFAEEMPNPYIQSMLGKSLMEDFVCRSKSMLKVVEDMTKVSKYDCNVIIFGDTGVGKEKAANIIQKNSERRM
ncbi:MAG: sigma 54-interacting transcriptional regulator, partial [Firmicutes bacterium]|nr:sigma 54-interacting transcriptional regulator [Bacillota bacterium]